MSFEFVDLDILCRRVDDAQINITAESSNEMVFGIFSNNADLRFDGLSVPMKLEKLSDENILSLVDHTNEEPLEKAPRWQLLWLALIEILKTPEGLRNFACSYEVPLSAVCTSNLVQNLVDLNVTIQQRAEDLGGTDVLKNLKELNLLDEIQKQLKSRYDTDEIRELHRCLDESRLHEGKNAVIYNDKCQIDIGFDSGTDIDGVGLQGLHNSSGSSIIKFEIVVMYNIDNPLSFSLLLFLDRNFVLECRAAACVNTDEVEDADSQENCNQVVGQVNGKVWKVELQLWFDDNDVRSHEPHRLLDRVPQTDLEREDFLDFIGDQFQALFAVVNDATSGSYFQEIVSIKHPIAGPGDIVYPPGAGKLVFLLKLPLVEVLEPTASVTSRSGEVLGAEVWENQRCIAEVLLVKACRVLHTDDSDYNITPKTVLAKFKKVNYFVFVPVFNSLKKQTEVRVMHVLKDDLMKPEDVVIKFGGKDSSLMVIKDNILKKIKECSDELFVLVLDECHYAPTASDYSTHNLINDPELCERLNFLVLCVSATPQNNMSASSRIVSSHGTSHSNSNSNSNSNSSNSSKSSHIKNNSGFTVTEEESNVLRWEVELFKAGISPGYIGLDFYISSIAITVPNACFATLKVTRDDCLSLVDLPLLQYTDVTHFASTLSVALKPTGVSFSFNQHVQEFWFTNTESTAVTIDDAEGSTFLREFLGFHRSPVFLPTKRSKLSGTNHCFGNGQDTNLLASHLREDSVFEALKEVLSPKIRPAAGRKDSGAPIPVKSSLVLCRIDLETQLQDINRKYGRCQIAPSKLAYPAMIDYILSMAYFGSCRVVEDKKSMRTRTILRSLDNSDPCHSQVNTDTAKKFLRMISRSCYCMLDTKGLLVDLTDLLASVLEYLFKQVLAVHIQLSAQAQDLHSVQDNNNSTGLDITDIAWVEVYLKYKLIAENVKKEQSEQEKLWFTETDRLVKMLLCDSPAPMIMLRVHDSDINLQLESVLRNAMTECDLTLCCNDPCSVVPAFSVIGDISNTIIYDRLDPYYQTKYNVSSNPEAGFESVKTRCTEDGIVRSATYEDLLNTPVLIILCEKGRMGDTFPHSLRALDLRLRCSGFVTTFTQEIGRMCRYPKRETIKIFSMANEAAELERCCLMHVPGGKSTAGPGSNADTIEMESTGLPHGVPSVGVGVDGSSGVGVGEAKSSSKHGVMFYDHLTDRYLATAEDVVSVKRIIAALVNARGVGLGEDSVAYAYPHIRVERIVSPLPYALVSGDVMNSLRDCLQRREAKVFPGAGVGARHQLNQNMLPLTRQNEVEYRQQNSLFAQDLLELKQYDGYLTGRTFNEFITPLTKKSRADVPLTDQTVERLGNCNHFDYVNKGDEKHAKHRRRLLLKAQCQIGKTNAYLHFINLMRSVIDSNTAANVEPDIPQPEPAMLIPGMRWIDYQLPYWKTYDEQKPLQYNFPQKGKYHCNVAQQRLDLILRIASQSTAAGITIAEQYNRAVQQLECIWSGKGLTKLLSVTEEVSNKLNLDIETGSNGDLSQDCLDYIRKLINWDGRFNQLISKRSLSSICSKTRVLAELSYIRREMSRGLNVHRRPILAHEITWQPLDGEGEEHEIGDEGENGNENEDEDGQKRTLELDSGQVGPMSAIPFRHPGPDVIRARVSGLPHVALTPLGAGQADNNNLGTRQRQQLSHRIELPRSYASGQFLVKEGGSAVLYYPDHLNLSNIDSRRGSISLSDFMRGMDHFHSGGRLKHWIFTPSYCSADNGSPGAKLLNRSDCYQPLQPWKDYVEVLVVRSHQVSAYRERFGSTHIIVSLPPTLMDVQCPAHIEEYSDRLGIGYARLFVQLLAYELGLEAVWMVDDNIEMCYKMECAGDTVVAENTQFVNCSFAEIMLHLQAVFVGELKDTHVTTEAFATAGYKKCSDPLVAASTLADVTGSANEFGILGIHRELSSHNPVVTHPIKRTHSIYSFFLLNVFATVTKRVFYPPKPVWEDIEMLNILDEKGFRVCKFRMFVHLKQLRKEYGFGAWLNRKYIYCDNDMHRCIVGKERMIRNSNTHIPGIMDLSHGASSLTELMDKHRDLITKRPVSGDNRRSAARIFFIQPPPVPRIGNCLARAGIVRMQPICTVLFDLFDHIDFDDLFTTVEGKIATEWLFILPRLSHLDVHNIGSPAYEFCNFLTNVRLLTNNFGVYVISAQVRSGGLLNSVPTTTINTETVSEPIILTRTRSSDDSRDDSSDLEENTTPRKKFRASGSIKLPLPKRVSGDTLATLASSDALPIQSPLHTTAGNVFISQVNTESLLPVDTITSNTRSIVTSSTTAEAAAVTTTATATATANGQVFPNHALPLPVLVDSIDSHDAIDDYSDDYARNNREQEEIARIPSRKWTKSDWELLEKLCGDNKDPQIDWKLISKLFNEQSCKLPITKSQLIKKWKRLRKRISASLSLLNPTKLSTVAEDDDDVSFISMTPGCTSTNGSVNINSNIGALWLNSDDMEVSTNNDSNDDNTKEKDDGMNMNMLEDDEEVCVGTDNGNDEVVSMDLLTGQHEEISAGRSLATQRVKRVTKIEQEYLRELYNDPNNKHTVKRGQSWELIADKFNDKFDHDFTKEKVRQIFKGMNKKTNSVVAIK